MFELEVPTTAKCLDLRVLSKKDRQPDDPPGAQFLLSANLPNDTLTMFDGLLKSSLYRKGSKPTTSKATNPQLDGIGPDSPELTEMGAHIKRFSWVYEQTGCSVEIDRGLGGPRSNIRLSDCKVHRVSIAPRDGGSVVMQWTIDAPAVADGWNALAGMKSTEIKLTIAGPEVDDGQQPIESTKRGGKSKREAVAA
jgi:hypothetical protein